VRGGSDSTRHAEAEKWDRQWRAILKKGIDGLLPYHVYGPLWDTAPARRLKEPDESDSPSVAEAEKAAQAADDLNDALASLFLELGPPPASTNADFAPIGSGDGGVQA
jgi:hypothetical protein